MMEEATALSNEIFELQEVFMIICLVRSLHSSLSQGLLRSNESIPVPPRKRRKIQIEETVENYAACLDEATKMLSIFEQSYAVQCSFKSRLYDDASLLLDRFHPHLVQTISKWSSKIQAVTPSVLLPSNRNAFLTKGSQQLKSVLQLIDETLAGHDKLLARTRLRRTKSSRIGDPTDAKEDVVEDDEVFDDTD